MHPKYDKDLLAAKVEWEGGVLAALEYGITSEDIEVTDISEAWSVLEEAYALLRPLVRAMQIRLERTPGEARKIHSAGTAGLG